MRVTIAQLQEIIRMQASEMLLLRNQAEAARTEAFNSRKETKDERRNACEINERLAEKARIHQRVAWEWEGRFWELYRKTVLESPSRESPPTKPTP